MLHIPIVDCVYQFRPTVRGIEMSMIISSYFQTINIESLGSLACMVGILNERIIRLKSAYRFLI